MEAAAARLDIPRDAALATVFQACGTVERGQRRAIGLSKGETTKRRSRCPAALGYAIDLNPRRSFYRKFQGLDQFDEREAPDLAGNAIIATVVEEIIRVKRGVMTVETDSAERIDPSNPCGNAGSEAKGGVHWHGDADEASLGKALGVEVLDGDVEGVGREPGALQNAERQRHREWLMAEFVAGD